MITKRIIPCLDVKNGRVVKGVNFEGLHDVSSPIELAEYYTKSGADELVFYDITASAEGRGLFTDILRETASRVFIPLTVGGQFRVFGRGGRDDTGMEAIAWIKKCVDLGAGEIVVNSIDTDGVKGGFDLEMLDAVCHAVSVPVIASGGAGKVEDFTRLFQTLPGVDAGLAASVFHFGQIAIPDLKAELRKNGILVR